MKYIVNSQEMKQYDQNTTERFQIPSIVLMERAALAFVEELKKKQLDLSKVLIVCGNGNNGGDGLAIARLIKLQGVSVDIVLIGNGKSGTEQNLLQQEILKAYQIEIMTALPENVSYTVVIDAVFGVGLSRAVQGAYAELLMQMNALSGKKIAVDIASGISADDGAVLKTAFRADVTITFAYAKIGMMLWPGSTYSGEVIVRDIGIDGNSWCGEKPRVAALEDSDFCLLPERTSHSNKGTYGKLLVAAGSVNMAGAAILSGKAAYAAGCGLVRIVTPEENRTILQTALPEALLTTLDMRSPDISKLDEAIKWADAIVCGPGLGQSAAANAMVRYLLKNASIPLLLDADALNLAAKDRTILLNVHAPVVITPHLGEMSRLTQRTVNEIQTGLLEVAEMFAAQYNVVCVLKDARTVTCVPNTSGQKNAGIYLNLSGNNGMATAGSGDVLSGIIGSLMAQGLCAGDAAPLGVYLHGRAGDAAVQMTGTRSLMAPDIIEGLKPVLM